MSSRSPRGARRRSAVLLPAVVVLTVVGWPGGARPALAHEFTLALVTPTSAAASAELDGSDVVDGFRLAVDRSPDVSHPPGADAGDHLGGVDVDVSLIDGTNAAEAAAAVEQQVGAGLTAVVVVAADATARAVATELQGSSVLLVVARGAGAGAPAEAGALQLQQASAPAFDSAVAADVAAAFQREHGRGLSAAAALGYDAGRLLDAAVARADDGIEDVDSVIAAGAGVDDELVSAKVSATERPRVAGPSVPSSGDGRPSFVTALAGGGLVALLSVLAASRARGRRARRGVEPGAPAT